jgi:GNAT superfamily N-acetyltransferase
MCKTSGVIEVVRVDASSPEWQRAGVHYVRTEGMVKGFDLPMHGEFSGDTGASEYVLLLDEGFPVATCRIRPLDGEHPKRAKIERVCVLSERRASGLGRLLISAAEKWLLGRGYTEIVIASREAVVGFYERLGYAANWDESEDDEYFRSIYTYKTLGHESGKGDEDE